MEKSLPSYPECKSWLIFISTALFVFYVMSQIVITNSLSDYLINKFNLDSIQFSQASSVYLYACVISVIPAGYLLDRFGLRYPILFSAFFNVAGALLFVIATNYEVFLLGRFLSGLGNNVAFFAPLRIASLIFPADKQATAKGFIFTAAMLGGLVTQAPLILLSKYVNVETILFSNVILGSFIFILLTVCLYTSNQLNQLNSSYNSISLLTSLNILLKKKQNWLCAFYASLVNLVFIILATLWGNLYLIQTQHFSNNTASIIMGFVFLGVIIGSPLLGWLSRLFKTRLALMQLCAIIATISHTTISRQHAFIFIVEHLVFSIRDSQFSSAFWLRNNR